jgi:hypothetical protein
MTGGGRSLGYIGVQPRTQAQITKNRHTTVLLYRSVATLSERAGVLGEDAAG